MKFDLWVNPLTWPAWAWLILAALLLAAGWPLGRALVRAWTVHRQWRRWRPFVRRAALQAAWDRFILPAAEVPGHGRVDLFAWLDTELHDPQPVRTRFLLLGPPESGRTTALLRWAARAHPGFEVLYRSLAHPQALEGLADWPAAARTLLLLDGLDEDPALRQGVRARLDAVLEATAAFGRLVISASPDWLPPEPGSERQPAWYHFVGERQYQVFVLVHLLPWPPGLVLRQAQATLRGRRARRQAAQLLAQLPDLLTRPGWAQALPLAVASDSPPQGFWDLTALEVHHWLGRQPDPEAAFRLLVDLAGALYQRWEAEGRSFLDAQAWAQLSPPRYLRARQQVLLHEAGRGYGFRHRRHWAWLLAWRAYHLPDTALPAADTWPQAVQGYREAAWAQLLRMPEAAAIQVRLTGDPALHPAPELPRTQLASITRLYLPGALPEDLRLLGVLPALRGLYFRPAAPLRALPASLIEALPQPSPAVYVPRAGGGWQAWQSLPLALAGGPRGSRVQAWQVFHPLHGLALWEGPLSDPARGHRRILSALPAGWDQWPQPGDKEEPVTGTGAPLEVRIFSRIIAPAWLDLFDQMRVYQAPGGLQHLLLENRHRPTFFIPYIAEATNRLVALLGEDDHYRAEFDADDAAQVEDGHWTGRRWTRQNTDAYAYPVLLYLEDPWRVRLWVLG